jgi:sigma-B regulation protein RsbU (phosphoserine phosphatase)
VGTASRSPRVGLFGTVRTRVLFWVLAVTIPIYAGALYMSRDTTARRLEAGAERDADQLAARLATEMDGVIREIEGGVRTVGSQLEEADPPHELYPQLIHGILNAWPDVYGSTIAVEVPSDSASAEPFAPYYFRRAGTVHFSDLAKDSYAYSEQPWYRRAVSSGAPVWSPPYYDAGGGEAWMVTYSVPFFRKVDGERALAGVVTADLDLAWMRKAAASAELGTFGRGWLASPPAAAESFIAPIGGTAEREAAAEGLPGQTAIRAAGEAMLARHSTFDLLPTDVAANPTYLAVRTLETLDWRVMLVVPQADLLAEADALLHRQLVWGAVGLVILIVALWIVAAGVAQPLHALAQAVGSARGDDLSFHLPAGTRRDEIGVLTDALSRLRDSLKDHIRLRAETLVEQARLKHELEIAASIQQSMLPKRDRALELEAAEIAAALLPAREVGGDLYDYFTIRDGQLLFAVGDVSDKGIPAALFMARLSALLRVLGAEGHLPDRLLAGINARLVEGNEACMFVTIGCGLLDMRTGRIRYASAGHEPPLLRDLDGVVRPLAGDSGAAIGIDSGAEYRLNEGYLAPGDTLVLCTDGVTEAEAEDGTLFGADRLADLLRDAPDGEPAGLVKRIMDTVVAHTIGGFHATDDVTSLAVRFAPRGVESVRDVHGAHWRMHAEVSAAGVRDTVRRLHGILAARNVDAARIGDVELIGEELLTNIVRDAESRSARRQLAVDCALTPAEIVLTFRDDGPKFNPLERERVDLEAHIAERRVGGLGIHLVRELAEHCSYARSEDWNVLEIRLGRTSAKDYT